jgi:2-oxoglutarate dehydrogenase complex dehydrogenase (E1) component-like enzyme
MAEGTRFQPVLGDNTVGDSSRYVFRVYSVANGNKYLIDVMILPYSVEKVVFVSGKLYYDLIKERDSRGLTNKIALCRIEVFLLTYLDFYYLIY